MTLDEIRELIRIVTDTGVAELEVQRGEDRVRIRRTTRGAVHHVALPPDQASAPAQHPAAHKAPPAEAAADSNVVTVKSPIVGTFYEAPSPDAPAFVRAGDTVKPGDVLCIIESMKLMNEIEADIAGTIATRFVNNAQPVEYGEALFAIRPA
jgi:acetyl-CoA carboxylase biotin carboxyl carrier protein